MKLGTETGSLINHLTDGIGHNEEITVGMPATLLSWTDRSPATVVDVFTKGKYSYVRVQSDDWKAVDGSVMSENVEYVYTPNPEGGIATFRVVEGGFQRVMMFESGRYNKVDTGGGLVLGKRERYYDPSF